MDDIDLMLCELDKNYYVKILNKFYIIYQQYILTMFDKMNSDYSEMQRKTDDDYVLSDMADLFSTMENSFIASWICIEYQKWQQLVYLYIAHEKLANNIPLDKCTQEKYPPVDKIFSRYGVDVKSFASWGDIDEMRLVVNVVKHFTGKSYNVLLKKRPDLFILYNEYDVKRAAIGSGEFKLNLKSEDYYNYHNALVKFWNELYTVINDEES